MSLPRTFLILAVVTITACGGDDDAVNRRALPRAACGMSSYTWLPVGATGAVLEDQLITTWPAYQLALAQTQAANDSGLRYERPAEHDVQVHRIRYQTQDRGELVDATGIVVFPDEPGPTPFPVILFLHGTSGFMDDCAPSIGIEDSEHDNFGNAAVMAIFASWGYAIVAPDYIGLRSLGEPSTELHPYLVGEPTAVASWDALRAGVALIEEATGQEAALAPIVVWGGSQGGHAAAFTVRYGPLYAPEFDVVAGVYGTPPTNLLGHCSAALETWRNASANTLVFFATAEPWYGPFATGLSPVLAAPHDATVQDALMASCSPQGYDDISTLEQVFSAELLAAIAEDRFDELQPWHCMVAENSLPTTSEPRLHDVPALMIVAEADDLVDPQIERDSFATLCAQGERLSLLECAGAAHVEGFFWAVDDAFDFIDARLAGEPMLDTCVAPAAARCANTPE